MGKWLIIVNENNTRLEIVSEEASIVRKIFELYAYGKGLKAITNQLNNEGYKTKKGYLKRLNFIKHS